RCGPPCDTPAGSAPASSCQSPLTTRTGYQLAFSGEAHLGNPSGSTPLAIVTGSGGLIGSEAVTHLVEQGYDVVGLENDLRAWFFGPEASTAHTTQRLLDSLESFHSIDADIRDAETLMNIVAKHRRELELVVHAAAQPSHDWAASDAQTDFGVNANGTLNLLEAVRHQKPEATFIFMSTNKVYGDRPNY